VPVDVSVRTCVAVCPTSTLPKLMFVPLMLRVDTAAFNCSAKLFVTALAVPESVPACVVVTDATVAVNPTTVAPAGTVTVAGTVTAELLLERLTVIPPLGAALLNVTLHASVPAPVIEEFVHDIAFKSGVVEVPVPLRLTTADGLVEELLVIVNWPVAAPAVVGSN